MPEPSATVTAECVGCRSRREIEAGEVAPDSLPFCNKCGSPMVAVRATARGGKGSR